jgi:lipopolysaccharide transport protein LptA/LPS export ABC transporter protein LptC
MHDMADVSFGQGNDRGPMFRAAMRHSRMVRFYRRAIPVGLMAIMLTIAAVAYFQPLKMLPKLSIDPLVVLSDRKINMEAPELGGFTRDGRPYKLTARAAAQDLTNPGVLELKDVRARIEMQDKNTVNVSAATGVYDTKGDTMVLKTDVVVSSTAGYSVRMNEAQIDVKSNRMVSDKSVEVTLANGTVKSRRMDVSENGDLMRFTGDVDVYLVPQEPASTEGAANAAAPSAATKSSAPPNAMQGFSQNRNQPVRIKADALEVRNQKKVATYTGNVHLTQGDTTLRSKSLIVYYDGDQAGGQAPKAGTPAGGGSIRNMEAIGQVVVTQNDQTATGDKAVYDMPTSLITLSAAPGGYVAVAQGPNQVEGVRLVVHVDTGVSNFEGGVRSRFVPGSNNGGDAKPTPDPKPAPPHQARSDAKALNAPSAAAKPRQ